LEINHYYLDQYNLFKLFIIYFIDRAHQQVTVFLYCVNCPFTILWHDLLKKLFSDMQASQDIFLSSPRSTLRSRSPACRCPPAAATSQRPCHHTRLRRRTHLNPRPCPRSSPPRYHGRYPAGCYSPSRLQLYLCSPRHAVAIAALELHHGVHSCSHGHNHLRRHHPRPSRGRGQRLVFDDQFVNAMTIGC
jgi:hypothetical protein